jgi:excisionase family DNA binding protein
MNQIVTKYEVLTTTEAAHFLRIKKTRLLELAEQGLMPARKIDDDWRFLRSALEEWLRGKSNLDAALLQQAGLFKDDPDLPRILDDIYKARGRPEYEED